MEGNPPPRIYETDSGMLNAIGLQNVGAKRFLGEKLPFLRTLKARTVVNVFAYSTEDYVRCIEMLNEGEGIAAYELNISCPNTRCGGIVYGSDPHLTEEVVAASKKAARYPLFVKLSPNVTDIALFARVAEAPAPTRSPWSTPLWEWPSTLKRARRGFPTSRRGFPDRPSNPWPCAWFTRPRAP